MKPIGICMTVEQAMRTDLVAQLNEPVTESAGGSNRLPVASCRRRRHGSLRGIVSPPRAVACRIRQLLTIDVHRATP
jgi:hypothetical protein